MQTYVSDWCVAIFTARESISTLSDCLNAARIACKGHTSIIDVLVNGNRQLAEEVAAQIAAEPARADPNPVRVWFIAAGDKAHTWNEYVHSVCADCALAFFIDGYTVVRPDAFAIIAAGLEQKPLALGASGVPTSGNSAEALKASMLKGGGIHGNLYAIRGGGLAAARDSGFRLPLGLYRTDSMVGAALMFNMDPVNNVWDRQRIFVNPDATWFVKITPWWLPRQLRDQWKRKLRQAQGHLENRAARSHLAVNRAALKEMPRTVAAFVDDWVAQNSQEARQLLWRNPLALHALRKLRQPRDWTLAATAPELMASTAGVEFDVAQQATRRA